MKAREIGRIPSNYVPRGMDPKTTVRYPISTDDLNRLNKMFGEVGTLTASKRFRQEMINNRTRLVDTFMYDAVQYHGGQTSVSIIERTNLYQVTANEHPYWYLSFGSLPIDKLTNWWNMPIEVSRVSRDGGNSFWDEISVVGLFRNLSFVRGAKPIDWNVVHRAGIERVRLLSFDPFLSEIDKMSYLSELS